MKLPKKGKIWKRDIEAPAISRHPQQMLRYKNGNTNALQMIFKVITWSSRDEKILYTPKTKDKNILQSIKSHDAWTRGKYDKKQNQESWESTKWHCMKC